MQHKILLLDELGDKWGKTHIYHDLKTPADAIRLLCINYPDFAKHIATSHEEGIFYKVTQANCKLNIEDLFLPLGKNDLVITPVISGSGSTFRAIVGIGLTFFTGGITTTFTAFGKEIAVKTLLKNIGGFLLLSSVSEMLAPQPPAFDATFDVGRGGFLGGPSAMERGADGQQSYAYRGASNTVGIGATIPVAYGKVLIGSHLISTDIDVVNESDPLMTSFERPSNGTVRVNGQKILYSKKIKDYDGLRAARVDLSRPITSYQGPNGNRVRAYDTSGNLNVFDFVLHKTNAGQNSPDLIGFVNLLATPEQKVLDNLSINKTGDRANENFNVMITFSGLQDRVGDADSTIIQGYITFAIKIKDPDTESVVLHQQLTVQGTQKFTQQIRYIFEFEPAVVEGASSYDVFVQVIDTGLFKTAMSTGQKDGTKMRIESVGYDLLGEIKNVE